MKAMRGMAILFLVSSLVAGAQGQNGHVKFRGTVAADEDHDVVPVCYGAYFVDVSIEEVLEDAEAVLTGLASVQVCYEDAHHLVSGDRVEVSGYYWGGACPRQYCGRVQVLEESDYIKLVDGYGDNDWMVLGDSLYSIPSGNVGIGTSRPQEKLHVAGNLRLEGTSPVWLTLMGGFADDAGLRLTTMGLGVNMWQILRDGATSDLLIRESFPYPPFSRDPFIIKAGTGNIGVGTTEPDETLHVLGGALFESHGKTAFEAPLRVLKEGEGRQLLAYLSNPKDGPVEVELQLAGGKMLPWGWSLKAGSGMFTLGSVAAYPPALNVTSTGYLGLGDTQPAFRLELPNTASAAGQARANSWKTYSSERWKTNVRPIEHAMRKVKRLRGVYFDWKGQGKRDMGLIAEEVGPVIPEVVDYEDNATDARSLAYGRLVALLIEALKEQEARIAELEAAIGDDTRLERRVEALEQLLRQPSLPRSDRNVRP